MSGCSNCIKSGIVGGIILFIWSAISWMALPWHMDTLHGFTDETAVVQTITSNASQSGIYVLPFKQMDVQQGQETQQTPQVFASINLQGMGSSMAKPMGIGLIGQIIAAMLVAWLLSKTSGLGYFGKLGFIFIFAVTVAIIADVPNWNWFAFDTHYTLVMMADTLIGWVLAGLVMAKLVKA